MKRVFKCGQVWLIKPVYSEAAPAIITFCKANANIIGFRYANFCDYSQKRWVSGQEFNSMAIELLGEQRWRHFWRKA